MPVPVPLQDFAARRVHWFARALDEFFGSFRRDVHGDGWNFDFARAWARHHMTEDRMRDAVRFELRSSGYRPTLRCLLVTPSNGTTSGIVALFWAYLGSREVDLLPSRSDSWTTDFVRILRDHDEDGAVRVFSKDEVALDDFVREHSAVVVYGSDATVGVYRSSLAGARVPVLEYGSKTSFAVHDRDGWSNDDTARYFRDLVAADGLGCLNPVVIYTPAITTAVADGLLDLSDKITDHYRGDAIAAVNQREFRSENVISGRAIRRIGLFMVRSVGAFESYPTTRGYGTAYVVEIGDPWDVAAEWSNVRGWVCSVTLSTREPFSRWSEVLAELAPSRITEHGEAQRPPLTWSHDNQRNLLPLVQLVDVELHGASLG